MVTVAPALERTGDFRAFLSQDFDEASTYTALRNAEGIVRPIGSRDWLVNMAKRTSKPLLPGKRGPKPKGDANQGLSGVSL